MIGNLRHKITLLTEQIEADAGGGTAVTWVAGDRLWASVERLQSTQDFLGERRRRLKRIAATVRYRASFMAGLRLLYGDDVFEITSVEDIDDRRRRLTLICEEVSL